MPRIARVVVPGYPHHVTQRGNRRADVFFDPQEREQYLSLLREYAERHGVRIWAYCLMTNHVHFVAVPLSPDALGRGFRDTHQAYASWLNRRLHESGHLWQGRFFSAVLDDAHLWAAVRYVERNPVRAGLVDRAQQWPWSSAAAHCGLRTDAVLSPIAMPWPVADWSAYLRTEEEEMVERIRRQTLTGRPCGGREFVARLEEALGRILHPRKRGPKPKKAAQEEES
jgi:putative transposase